MYFMDKAPQQASVVWLRIIQMGKMHTTLDVTMSHTQYQIHHTLDYLLQVCETMRETNTSILAGYKDDIQASLGYNMGFPSRFPKVCTFNFDTRCYNAKHNLTDPLVTASKTSVITAMETLSLLPALYTRYKWYCTLGRVVANCHSHSDSSKTFMFSGYLVVLTSIYVVLVWRLTLFPVVASMWSSS